MTYIPDRRAWMLYTMPLRLFSQAVTKYLFSVLLCLFTPLPLFSYAAEQTNASLEEVIQAAQRNGSQVIIVNPPDVLSAQQHEQQVIVDQRSGLAKMRAETELFRNDAEAFISLLPQARSEMLFILRSSSPDGSIFFYVKMIAFSLLFFTIGYYFTRSIYGKRIVGPWFIARQIANPIGYSDKLPILVTRFLLGFIGILLTMLVAYILDSVVFGKAKTQTEMLTIGYIYFAFFMVNIISLFWRMILSPFLPDYRIPRFHTTNNELCTQAAKKLYRWLWIGGTLGISFNLLIAWLGELGVSPTIYGVLNLYLTGITVTQTISLLFAVLITISIMLVAMTIEAHERVLTKRRNLQQQVKINELQSYSDLFTDSVVGLYTSSLNGQLIRVNPAMCALFGYADESEMLKRVDNTDKFYADPQDRAIMLGEIHKNEKVLGKKILGIHKDNSHFWFSISCQIVQRQEQRFLYGSIVAATELETNKNNPDEPNQPPESSYVDEATSLQKSVKGNKPKKGWMPQINLALQHDSFELHYQHYQALSQHAAGHHYEIFLRIKDSKGNLVKASTFLPDAEQHNLSAKIDRWVIEYYFSWLNNNPQHLEELSRVSINLSGDSLADQDLKLFVLNAFEKYQIPHQKVCFDIGESLAVMQMDETLEFIDTFQKLGCLIALDDFGMGASSFHNLKQLPVHQIKIDGNFIKDMLVEPINLVMVNSIKEVAKAMNIETVAEFVESTEIMVELGKMGIDFAQGNGVATPQALTEFTPHR